MTTRKVWFNLSDPLWEGILFYSQNGLGLLNICYALHDKKST